MHSLPPCFPVCVCVCVCVCVDGGGGGGMQLTELFVAAVDGFAYCHAFRVLLSL
jgi:hypothetical protein